MGPPLHASLSSEWRHCTGLGGRYNLWEQKKSSFLNDLSGLGWRCRQDWRETCGSGRAREASYAMDGTGFAGVRGHARSHKGRAQGLK